MTTRGGRGRPRRLLSRTRRQLHAAVSGGLSSSGAAGVSVVQNGTPLGAPSHGKHPMAGELAHTVGMADRARASDLTLGLARRGVHSRRSGVPTARRANSRSLSHDSLRWHRVGAWLSPLHCLWGISPLRRLTRSLQRWQSGLLCTGLPVPTTFPQSCRAAWPCPLSSRFRPPGQGAQSECRQNQ